MSCSVHSYFFNDACGHTTMMFWSFYSFANNGQVKGTTINQWCYRFILVCALGVDGLGYEQSDRFTKGTALKIDEIAENCFFLSVYRENLLISLSNKWMTPRNYRISRRNHFRRSIWVKIPEISIDCIAPYRNDRFSVTITTPSDLQFIVFLRLNN